MSTAHLPLQSTEFAPHPKQGRARSSIFGVGWSLLHTALPSVSALGIFLLAAAYLAPEDFGRLAIAGGLVSVALALSPAAFGEALIQRASIAPGHADAVFWLNLGIGIAFFVSLHAIAELSTAWFGEPDLAWLVPLLALKVPFDLAAVVPSAMIIRAMRFRAIAIRTAIASAIGAAFGIALLLSGYGLLALAVSQVVVSVVACAAAFWVAKWQPGFKGRMRHLRDLFSYSVFASGQRVLGTLRLDHLVAGALGGAMLLGLLSFAQRFFQMLADIAAGALGNVTHVVLSSMQDDARKSVQTFEKASFAAACLGFPAFAGAALIVGDIIWLLFGDKWAAAITATQVFCLAGLIATPGIVQGALIRARGYPNRWFYYQLLQQIGTVAAIALTYSQGVTAVVIAIVAKTFLFWPISAIMTVRLLEGTLSSYIRPMIGPALATVGMASALLLLPFGTDWGGVASQVILGAVIYTALIVLLCRSQVIDVFHAIKVSKAK
ncbi:MAG: oligosaccharide flippase family protein [Pseudomonadota bacterium]